MMKELTIRLLCLLAFVNLSAQARQDSPACRIMPVGDSVTEGGRDFCVYREPLLKMLKTAGYSVEYVGSKTTNGGFAHEGYGGKNAEYLAKVVPKNFEQHPADIVLVHAGHNHFAEQKPVAGIVAATESMITAFRKVNPRVAVFVAKVIPSAKLPKYSYIPGLNAELGKMAERLSKPDQPVLIVDQFQGFDPGKDTIADKVHPNARGAEKMAARWFEALKPVLDKTR